MDSGNNVLGPEVLEAIAQGLVSLNILNRTSLIVQILILCPTSAQPDGTTTSESPNLQRNETEMVRILRSGHG